MCTCVLHMRNMGQDKCMFVCTKRNVCSIIGQSRQIVRLDTLSVCSPSLRVSLGSAPPSVSYDQDSPTLEILIKSFLASR